MMETSAQLPTVPGFTIEKEIGRGGMAYVYRAEQIAPPRTVALKLLRPHASPAVASRLEAEAEALTRLQHPNVVEVFAVGQHAGRPYLVMEYCNGSTLKDRMLGQPLPPRPAAELTATLARAVQYCHEQGVLHRDLKPGNILLHNLSAAKPVIGDLQSAVPKIADFGLAKLQMSDVNLTVSGAVLGSIGYMSPEQATGGTKYAGPPTDIWALGCVLYELLCGDPPVSGPVDARTLTQIMEADPPPLDAPPPLVAICLKCLRKKPDDRYATAGALADDLDRWLRGEPVAAETEAEKLAETEAPTEARPGGGSKWGWLTPWRKRPAE
jgi:serine/threonine protein kinase